MSGDTNMISGTASSILVPTAPVAGSTAAYAPTFMTAVETNIEQLTEVTVPKKEDTVITPPATTPTVTTNTSTGTGIPTTMTAEPAELGTTPPSGTVDTETVLDPPTELTGTGDTGTTTTPDTGGPAVNVNDQDPDTEPLDEQDTSDTTTTPALDKKDLGFIIAGVSAGLIAIGSFIYFFLRSKKKK